MVNFALYSIQIHPNHELINPIMSYFFRECNIVEIQRKFREIFDVSPKEILLPKVSVIKSKRKKVNRCPKDLPVRRSQRLKLKKTHSVSSTAEKQKKKVVKFGNKSYPCPKCPSAYSFKNSLAKHMNRHEANDVAYSCDICKKKFIRKDSVKRHKDSVHAAVKNFNCSICNMCFTLKANLIKHYRLFHSN